MLLIPALASVASAFTLTPMSVTLEPSGQGANQSFQIDNESTEEIAIEISVTGREMEEDGTEHQPKTEEIAKRFLIYPQQVILKPGEKRTVRISWTGPAELERELAYRLIAEQLPVDLKKREEARAGAIRMLLKYVAAIYVRPKNVRSELTLSAKKIPAKKSSPALLELTFKNKGGAHQILHGLHLKFGETLTLAPEKLQEISGQNVLAQSTRRFTIPWPKELAAKTDAPLRVEFELKD